jgi:hypothetical protein
MEGEVDSPTTVTRAWVLLDIITKAKELQAEQVNLIQQAAEDYRKNSKYVQGIGSIEKLKEMEDDQYKRVVTHYLEFGRNSSKDLRQDKWAVVRKCDIENTKEAAENWCRQYNDEVEKESYTIVKIIEP